MLTLIRNIKVQVFILCKCWRIWLHANVEVYGFVPCHLEHCVFTFSHWHMVSTWLQLFKSVASSLAASGHSEWSPGNWSFFRMGSYDAMINSIQSPPANRFCDLVLNGITGDEINGEKQLLATDGIMYSCSYSYCTLRYVTSPSTFPLSFYRHWLTDFCIRLQQRPPYHDL